MNLLVAEIEENMILDQDEVSASAENARDVEGRKPHPCFAESEFGNILRLLAEQESEIDKVS